MSWSAYSATWNAHVEIKQGLDPATRQAVVATLDADPRCPDGSAVGDDGRGEWARVGVVADSAAEARFVAVAAIGDALAKVGVATPLAPGDVFDDQGRLRHVVPDFDALIVDLDGVVWLGDEQVAGSASAIASLRASGVVLVFLTNDPRRSRPEYAERLSELGIPASADDIVSAGSALAALVAESEGHGCRVYVVGSPSLKAELAAVGELVEARDAEVVAVGGHDSFDYRELRAAAQAVRRGARLYAAGRDATFPMPDGPWPGTGAVVAAIEVAGGEPALAAGKPEPFIFAKARARLGGRKRVAVVGDNVAADVAGGVAAGLQTFLVLTGTTSRADLAEAVVKPDLIVDDLGALARLRLANGKQHSAG